MKFVPAGPERYTHQRRALRRIIDTAGVCALLMDPGCLAGDTSVSVNRAGKGWDVSLRALHDRFNGIGPVKWRKDIPTMIRRAMPDGTLRLGRVLAVLDSGVKPVYTLTLSTGQTLTGTAEHPVLTPEGYVELTHLAEGDRVVVEGERSTFGNARRRGERKQYKDRYTRFHPHQRKEHRPGRFRRPEHILIVEAGMNGLALAEFLRILNTDAGESAKLEYLPRGVVVHHRDGNHRNNDPSNLVVTTQAEHAREHGEENARNVLVRWTYAEVESVEYAGEQQTYDVTVADDPHNFMANGIATHNTGKTAVALDYLSLLALKAYREVDGAREVRALVVSPKAAVDNWAIQAETYVHEKVDVWAEALGGSIEQKCATLRSRGPEPYKPRKLSRKKDARQIPYRALNADRAELIWTRGRQNPRGPVDVGSATRPRLVLLSTNLETFASRSRRGSGTMADYVHSSVQAFKPDVIIVDESHKIKGTGSNMSRLLSRVGQLSPRRLILTGTPMPHSPMDVFAQWRFLKPTAFGRLNMQGERQRATYDGFQRRYGVLGGYMGREVISFQNLDEMQSIMGDNAIVVKKEDALDLPKATDAVFPVVLSPREQSTYDRMKKDLAASLGTGALSTAQNKLTQLLRLRQITAGHLPTDSGGVEEIGTTKVDAIRSLVHDTLEGEKRLVIFAVFRHEIAALRDRIEQKSTEVLVIDGRTPQDERLRMRRRFGSDDPARIVLIAQVRTISLSVNELVTASHAIFATLSQQRDDLVQARDRLNRIGQTRPTTFWVPLARGTVDEVIWRSHQGRTDLESDILKHVQGTEPAESVL